MRRFIAPLGCDLSANRKNIGPETIERCRRALKEYQKKGPHDLVYIVLAPGCHPRERTQADSQTMAVMMANWFCSKGVPENDLIVNETDKSLWGTSNEVNFHIRKVREWIRGANVHNSIPLSAVDVSEELYLPVTNALHGVRVARLFRFFNELPVLYKMAALSDSRGAQTHYPRFQLLKSEEIKKYWSVRKLCWEIFLESGKHVRDSRRWFDGPRLWLRNRLNAL